MPKQPEAKFKARLKKAFSKRYPDKKSAGFTDIGTNGFGQKSGYPDLHFHFVTPSGPDYGETPRAGTVWLEAKVHPYKLEDHQARRIAALRNAGDTVIVATYHPETKLIHAEWSATYRADFPSAEAFWANV